MFDFRPKCLIIHKDILINTPGKVSKKANNPLLAKRWIGSVYTVLCLLKFERPGGTPFKGVPVLLQHIAFKSQDKTGHNQHVYLPGTFKEVRDFTVPHEFLGQPFT